MGIRTKAATPRLCGLFPFEVTCIGKRVVRCTVLLPAWVERAGVKLATRLKCHLGGRTSDSCTVLLKKRMCTESPWNCLDKLTAADSNTFVSARFALPWYP